jgi:hypothetical protein
MRRRRLATLALLAALGGAALAADEAIEPFALEDQHGVRVEVGAAVRTILLTRDMDGGGIVREALAGLEQAYLDERRAVYVADVSGMPGVVSRLIALPRMRRRPYRVLVDRDGSVSRRLPHVAGKATAIFLDGLRIARVAHLGSPGEVRAALEPPRDAGAAPGGD